MKKQSLLRLLSITTISMSLFFTSVNVYANTLNPCDIKTNPCVTPPSQCVTPQNPCDVPQDPPCVTPPSSGETDANKDPQKDTIDASIVLKGKNVTCGSKLDRLLALEYLNEDKTRPDFDDISISVTINGKTAELVEGAQVDLTEHNGEMIAINYKYEDKSAKTLKLKVDCTEEKLVIEFTDEVSADGILAVEDITSFDALQFVNVDALGGNENIIVKILDIDTETEVTTLESGKVYKVIYSLQNDPDVKRELTLKELAD